MEKASKAVSLAYDKVAQSVLSISHLI